MAVSQNGWPAYASSAGLVSFPWVTGRVRPGDVYTVLNYLARRFNAEVEGIEAWQSWGWNYRPVRGAVSLSNHSSGTAVDFNATRHVLGARGTFSRAQVAAIRRILAALGGVVRWGGDYSARADEMHFEINATPARVAAVARAIGAGTVSNPIGGGGSVTIPTVPGLPAPIEEDDMADYAAQLDTIQKQNEAVLAMLRVTGQPYGYPAALNSKVDALTTEVGAVKGGVAGVRDALKVPGQPFDYLPATHNAVASLIGEVAGLRAALGAVATGAGLTPEQIMKAAQAGAEQALKGITITVDTKD